MSTLIATVYAASFAGKPTACKPHTPYHPSAYTCAHRTIPCGTVLKLEYNGYQASCVINDRTASKYSGRLDLSQATWDKLTGGKEPGKIIVRVVK